MTLSYMYAYVYVCIREQDYRNLYGRKKKKLKATMKYP